MPYLNHWKVSFGGGFDELDEPETEIWNCNINVVPVTPGSFVEDTYMASIQSGLAAWWVNAVNKVNTLATLKYIKCNQIGPDGKYVTPGTPHTYTYGTIPGGATTPTYPLILTTCFSWRTALTRGPGSHGRIYIPNQFAVSAPGYMKLGSGVPAAAATAAKALLTVIRNSSGPPLNVTPVVASKVGSGLNQPITGVAVGDVLDVQRRRKDVFRESYSTLAFP